MEWYRLEETKVLKELHSSHNGLEEKEASKRLTQYGCNELKEGKRLSPLKILLNQFTSVLVIILILATLFSFAIGEILDGSVILIIVILNSIFGFVQEYKAGRAIEALKKLTSPESIVLRGGRKRKLASRLLVPGDIVFLEEGTKIPADMRLLEVTNLRIDESSLTGESTPVTKSTKTLKKAIVADRKNMAYAGTHVTYGRGIGIITTTGMDTEIGKIAHMIGEAGEVETPLQKRLKVFSKNLGIIILLISLAVVAGGLLRQYELFDMVLTGIALAVAAIPEGLPAVVTITLALGLQKLSGENALIRRLPAVETLGSTSVICSDKTGTLTKNEMTVRKVWLGGSTITVTGRGYSPKGDFLFKGKPLKRSPGLSLILKIGGLCNNATLTPTGIIGDPTEGAVLIAAAKGEGFEKLKTYKRIGEVPFSSERKMMSTINKVMGKDIMFTKGAPEVVLERCTSLYLRGKVVPLTSNKRKEILEANQSLTSEALRVLGFAFREGKSSREADLVFVGMMGMIDPPRDTVKGDIETCRRAGIKTVMITGDHKNTAVAIAKEIGLHKEGNIVLTGEELDNMSDEKFRSIIDKVSVYARVNPSHKVKIVSAFKSRNQVVAMTGDGVNDAPALKRADIGISMGIKGTDVAKEASEMVLTDDNFSSIVSAVRAGRGIYDNINKFIRYLLSSNIAEVSVIFIALLLFSSTGEPLLPLLAVQILWINLITDGLPALAIGVDPAVTGIMSRVPRPLKEKLLSREALTFILFVGTIITVGTLWVFTSELPNGLQKAQTMAFTTMVVFELFNVFNVRGFLQKNGLSLLSNTKLLLAVAGSFILQLAVIYIPPLQEAFSTVPLTLGDWIKIFLVTITVLILWTVKQRISNH